MPGGRQDVLALWFWRKGSWSIPKETAPAGAPMPMYGRQGAFSVVAVDENGMESAAFMYETMGAGPVGSNTLGMLRAANNSRGGARRMKVRIYNNYNNNGYAMPPE